MHFLQFPTWPRGAGDSSRSRCEAIAASFKSDAAQNEFTYLPFEIGRVAVCQTGHGRKPRQRRHQHRVMRKPEQIERRATDRDASPAATARSSEAVKAGPIRSPTLPYSSRANSPSSRWLIAISRSRCASCWSGASETPGSARPCRGPVRPMSRSTARSPSRCVQIAGSASHSSARISAYSADLLGKCLNSNPSEIDGGGRDALGRGAGEAVTREATLGGAQDQFPAQIAGHAEVVMARE